MLCCGDNMKCPYCANLETNVIDSRDNKEKNSIRRRRECTSCKRRFTTYESLIRDDLLVVKRDSKREMYDMEKIRKGVLRSFDKLYTDHDTIQKIIKNVDEKIKSHSSNEIKSSEIGDIALNEIRKVNSVAYIRFAAVYKKFTSSEDFLQEINKINSV